MEDTAKVNKFIDLFPDELNVETQTFQRFNFMWTLFTDCDDTFPQL